MNGKSWMIIGIILTGLAVVMGAFGAHGLENRLSYLNATEFTQRIDNWKTGAMYQFYHSLGIIIIGIANAVSNRGDNQARTRMDKRLNLAAWLMLLGIVLFSGMLYLLTLTQFRVGMIVPLGGVAFIAGWIFFAVGVWRLEF